MGIDFKYTKRYYKQAFSVGGYTGLLGELYYGVKDITTGLFYFLVYHFLLPFVPFISLRFVFLDIKNHIKNKKDSE